MRLRLGIIGLGTAGLRHAAAAGRHPDVDLLAVADPAPAASRAAVERGLAWLADSSRLLERADIDAVVISLPHHLLAGAAIEAAQHGKHVLLEKPMGTSVSEAQAVVHACRAAGVRLMVNYVHRFREEYRRAHALLREGAVGRQVLIVDLMASGRSSMPAWVWRREESGGGMLMYNGAHSVDRLLWLAGSPVVSAQATMGNLAYPVDVEDNAVGTLGFADGTLGVLVQHKSDAPGTLAGWHTLIYGSMGAIRVTTGVGLELARADERQEFAVGEDDRFGGALSEFAAAVAAGRDCTPSGDDGLRVMRTIAALYAASDSGTRQAVEA